MELKNKTRIKITYSYGVALIISGLLLNYFGVGAGFDMFGSVGNWLVYIGFVSVIIATVRVIARPRKKLVDERMEFVAAKALRVTFLALIISAFIIMVYDGIRPITMSYHLFMSYFVCGILVVYMISYKALLRCY